MAMLNLVYLCIRVKWRSKGIKGHTVERSFGPTIRTNDIYSSPCSHLHWKYRVVIGVVCCHL